MKRCSNRAVQMACIGLALIIAMAGAALASGLRSDAFHLRNTCMDSGNVIAPLPAGSGELAVREGSMFRYETSSMNPGFGASSPAAANTVEPIRPLAIYFNPLGVVQFGPMAGAEIRVLPNIVFDLHLRWAALGLIYQALESEGFEDDVSFASAAAGFGARHFFGTAGSPNRFYVGGVFEYFWGFTSGADEIGDWEGEDAGIVLATNVGYRWIFPSGFFVNVGGFAGFGRDLKNDWWYEGHTSTVFEIPSETTVFGMLEVSFGLGI